LKKKQKHKVKKIVVISIALAIIAYISYIAYVLIKNPTNICVIKNGSVYEEEAAIGYIIREEVVIKSDTEIIPIIQEGEKVAKDSSVFKISNDIETDLKQKIEETKIQIQEKIYQGEKFSSSDIDLIEEDIDKKVTLIRNTKNYKQLQEYEKEINLLLDNKMEIIEKSETSNNEIRNLIKQKKEYQNQLNQNSQNVKSTISGIVSYRVDGLEEVLTKEKFGEINKQYLDNLNLRTNQIIATSKNSGKIINNFEGYILTVLKSEQAKNAKVGDKVTLRLYTNEEINAKIEYINKEDESNIIIAFKLNTIEEELIKYRKMSFDVIWWSKEGLKVPNEAIYIKENGLSYVTRNRSGYLTEVLVKIVVKNDDYSLVTIYDTDELEQLPLTEEERKNYVKIKLYDEIVIKEK